MVPDRRQPIPTPGVKPPLSRLNRLKGALASRLNQGMLRSVTTLVGGTVIGHAITMLAMPLSTRLFTPEDFSTLSVFSSIVGILVVIACLRYDAAIILPEDNADAINVFSLAVLSSAVTAIVLTVILFLIPHGLFTTLRVSAIAPYRWLLPIGVLTGGTYLAVQAWYVREKRFKGIARSRALQAAGAAGAQISMGFGGIAPLGLLIGYVTNFGAGCFYMLASIWRNSPQLIAEIHWKRMGTLARTYDKFPKYSTWEGLANGISNSGPLIIIAAMAPGPEAGYIALSLFVLQAPLALLGNAIGQVYVSEAAIAYREDRLGAFTATVLGGLVSTGTGPMVFIGIISPFCFELIFGSDWQRSGVLVAWMVPWFLLQFLSSPICNALHVTGHQRLMMIFHLFGVLLRVGMVVLAGMFASSIISEAWAISGLFFYAAYLAVILGVVKIPIGSGLKIMSKLLPSAVLGIMAGLGVLACMQVYLYVSTAFEN